MADNRNGCKIGLWRQLVEEGENKNRHTSQCRGDGTGRSFNAETVESYAVIKNKSWLLYLCKQNNVSLFITIQGKMIKSVCNNNARQFSLSCRSSNCWNNDSS